MKVEYGVLEFFPTAATSGTKPPQVSEEGESGAMSIVLYYGVQKHKHMLSEHGKEREKKKTRKKTQLFQSYDHILFSNAEEKTR